MSDHFALAVEFVLARIAEDEANADMTSVPPAALVQIAPGVQVWHTFGTTMPLNELHGAKAQWVVRTNPAQLHADSAAKRRLVALAERLGGEAGEQILRALMMPYAGRRDVPKDWDEVQGRTLSVVPEPDTHTTPRD